MLHSKTKGNVGELRVAADLAARGYAVFTELGDSSKIDLIADTGKKLLRIQVKTQADTSKGTIHVPTRSSGPGYSYYYTPDDIDYFAVYALDRDEICYIQVSEMPINKSGNRTGMILRFDKPKNNQTKGINMVENFRTI